MRPGPCRAALLHTPNHPGCISHGALALECSSIFAKISAAGRDLAKLHLNYETGPGHKLKKEAKFGDLEKIAFSRAKRGGKPMQDKTKLKANGIEAFDIPEIRYRVNGRTPIEWVADRYKVSRDRESGIINDPCQGMTEQKITESIEARPCRGRVRQDHRRDIKAAIRVHKLEAQKGWHGRLCGPDPVIACPDKVCLGQA